MADTLTVKVEFSGGLELLFSNQRSHVVRVPSVDPTTLKPADVLFLIGYLRTRLLTQRPELFVDNGSVLVSLLSFFILLLYLMRVLMLISPFSRPGILVLINDADWELEGEGAYVLREGDEVVFISTLNGG